MEVTSVNVEQANVQLDKARHYQVCCGKLISTVLKLCYLKSYSCVNITYSMPVIGLIFWNLTCHLQDT